MVFPKPNPIETLCTTLKSWFHTRKPTNLNELFCQEEWSNIQPELYQKLAHAYQNHLADVHLAEGHLTDYKHSKVCIYTLDPMWIGEDPK